MLRPLSVDSDALLFLSQPHSLGSVQTVEVSLCSDVISPIPQSHGCLLKSRHLGLTTGEVMIFIEQFAIVLLIDKLGCCVLELCVFNFDV